MHRKRLDRERRTIDAMLAIFCRDQHAPGGRLCHECAALSAYTRQRLEKCPFGADKPTCAKCPVHCYKPPRREQIKVVMRHAGPRLLFRRPILAIRHLLDERKALPELPRRRKNQAADVG